MICTNRWIRSLVALAGLTAVAMYAGADPGDPCRSGVGDADLALIKATSLRMVDRGGRGPAALHLFTRAAPSGCARVRFAIDAAGEVRDPVLEYFVPDRRFGREILQLVRDMRFTPATSPDGRDDALTVVSMAADFDSAEEARP